MEFSLSASNGFEMTASFHCHFECSEKSLPVFYLYASAEIIKNTSLISILSRKVFPRANRSSEMLCRGDFRARRKMGRAGLRLDDVARIAHFRPPRCRP